MYVFLERLIPIEDEMGRRIMEWIKVDRKSIGVDNKEDLHGVSFHVFVPPDDIPERVRGEYVDERSRFVIKFEYADGHRPGFFKKHGGEYVQIRVGNDDARIHRIEVEIDNLEINMLSLRIKRAIERYRRRKSRKQLLDDHYKAVEEVVDKYSKDIGY